MPPKTVIVQRGKDDTIAIEIVVPCGAVWESNKRERGLSHLLEHMMFKSKRDMTTSRLLLELNALGGQFNAMTSKDYTLYFIKTVYQNWERAYELATKIVFDAAFTQQDLDREKRVVLEELAYRMANPRDKVIDAAYLTLLGEDNPYSRDTKGVVKSIKRCKVKDLMRYYKSHYDTAMIYVRCPEGKKHVIEKHLVTATKGIGSVDWSCLPAHIPNAATSTTTVLQTRIIQDPSASGYATAIAFASFPHNDKRNIILEFVWDILAGSLNSLLMREMREKRGLVYAISPFKDAFFALGMTGLYFMSTSDDLKKAVCYIAKILKRLKERGLSPGVMAYSKAAYLNKMKYQLATDESYVDEQDVMRNYYGTRWGQREVLKTIARLTNDQVRDVCRDVFKQENACIVSHGNYRAASVRFGKIENKLFG